MTWQEIFLTPLFWVVSTIGTLVLSIVGNLLTPYTSAFITRHLHARRSGLREKQIKRREQVVALQANVHRRASAKLDAIFKFLLAMVLLSLCLFLLQLEFGRGIDIASGVPTRGVQLPILLVVLLALVGAIPLLKLGLDDMSLALTADRRETAGDDFLKQHGSASAEVTHRFEDEWDFREFGVTSQDAPEVSTHERA